MTAPACTDCGSAMGTNPRTRALSCAYCGLQLTRLPDDVRPGFGRVRVWARNRPSDETTAKETP